MPASPTMYRPVSRTNRVAENRSSARSPSRIGVHPRGDLSQVHGNVLFVVRNADTGSEDELVGHQAVRRRRGGEDLRDVGEVLHKRVSVETLRTRVAVEPRQRQIPECGDLFDHGVEALFVDTEASGLARHTHPEALRYVERAMRIMMSCRTPAAPASRSICSASSMDSTTNSPTPSPIPAASSPSRFAGPVKLI